MNFSVTGQPVLQIGVVSADVDGRFSLVKPNICYFSCLVSLVFIKAPFCVYKRKK